MQYNLEINLYNRVKINIFYVNLEFLHVKIKVNIFNEILLVAVIKDY